MLKRLKNSKGFTLIELLVVMAIIAILIVLIIFAIQSARRAQRDTQRRSTMETIKTGIEAYYASNRQYPGANGTAYTNLNTITGTGAGSLGLGTFISGAPLSDPTDGGSSTRYCYARVTSNTYTLRLRPEGQGTAAPLCTGAGSPAGEDFDMGD